jgi:hypothetical protein
VTVPKKGLAGAGVQVEKVIPAIQKDAGIAEGITALGRRRARGVRRVGRCGRGGERGKSGYAGQGISVNSTRSPRPAKRSASRARAARSRSSWTLLRRENGVTLAEIARATAWQNHSIRGFISGALTKKMGLEVESTKNEAGERTYRIK